WYAWLRDGKMGGGLAQLASRFIESAPVAVPLQKPRLFRAGWQPDPEKAVFAVLGLDEHQKVALALVTLRAEGPNSMLMARLGNSVLPAVWAVHRGKAGLDVVTSHEANGRTIVVRQTVLDDGTVAVPVKLGEGPSPLVALGLDPLGAEGPAVVDVLFGPEGDTRVMTFQRLLLDGGDPVLSHSFALGKLQPDAPSPEQWTLAMNRIDRPVVFYKCGAELLVRDLSGGAPRVVDEQAREAGNLGAAMIRTDVWLFWTDPVQGLVHRRL
ncbi:MAG: hypothetical protein ABIZ80_01240, partial [Bryobacteraceae bacterium]